MRSIWIGAKKNFMKKHFAAKAQADNLATLAEPCPVDVIVRKVQEIMA